MHALSQANCNSDFYFSSWIFGTVGCKLLSFISLLNLYSSVFFLVAMAIDRFLAVVFAVRFRNRRTSQNARRACIGIWIIACITAAQGLVFREVSIKMSTFLGYTICYKGYTIWDRCSR